MVKKDKDSQGYRPKVGEKVLCEHKGFVYEARVLNDRKDPENSDKMQFFVHYQGWNKSWDEWVGESRVLQHNEQNLAQYKDQRPSQAKTKGVGMTRKKLAIQQQNQSTASSISTQSVTSEPPIVAEPLEPVLPDKEVKIKIPDDLKNWLVDDDNCIKNKKYTVLPARTTISTILKDFVNHKKLSMKSPGEKEVVLNELTLGIRDYFNVMLGSQLLYKFERLQYQNLLKEHGRDVDLTNIYGVIHLIRLFTRIGRPLGSSTLDSQSIQTIVNYIQDLLRFISKQTHLFDLEKNYTIAPPDYIKNALK